MRVLIPLDTASLTLSSAFLKDDFKVTGEDCLKSGAREAGSSAGVTAVGELALTG